MGTTTTYKVTRPSAIGGTRSETAETKAQAYILFGETIRDVLRFELKGAVVLERDALGTTAEMARVIV